MIAPSEFNVGMQIAELQAELRVRRAEYPRLVARGVMRTSEATVKIACMEAAVATLMRVRDGDLVEAAQS